MPSTDYSPQQQQQMLAIARHAIAERLSLATAEPNPPDDAWLQAPAATFVTLTLDGELRGCIGCLQPQRPLLQDLQHNAVSAAFEDPRFPALTTSEFPHIHLHISLLGPCQPLQIKDETDLLAQLRPGLDGLILEEGRHRATFLPQVWRQLPDPVDFLQHLKLKAGLTRQYWSPRLRFSVYQVTEFADSTTDSR